VNVDLTAGTNPRRRRGGGGQRQPVTSIERVIGNRFGDFMKGSAGAETLEGREGNDTLSGMIGNDTLIGGAGQDSFPIRARSPGSATRHSAATSTSIRSPISFREPTSSCLTTVCSPLSRRAISLPATRALRQAVDLRPGATRATD
jgi:hypothetical protein